MDTEDTVITIIFFNTVLTFGQRFPHLYSQEVDTLIHYISSFMVLY